MRRRTPTLRNVRRLLGSTTAKATSSRCSLMEKGTHLIKFASHIGPSRIAGHLQYGYPSVLVGALVRILPCRRDPGGSASTIARKYRS
jgi:hypothetical protein